MDAWPIKSAVLKLIKDNEASLVNGLASDGLDKDIKQFTRSVLTRARIPYMVGVVCPEMDEYADMSNLVGHTRTYAAAKNRLEARYSIEVHVSDRAQQRSSEEPGGTIEHFETDQEMFDTFVGRLAELLRENETIPPETGSYTIEVLGDGSANDRKIRISDRSGYYPSGFGSGNPVAVLYAVVRFTVSVCGQPRPTLSP